MRSCPTSRGSSRRIGWPSAQDRIERIVVRVARGEHDDEDAVERLTRETNERLEDEDLLGDILQRPIGEVVALICKDLGLTPDWDLMATEAWAIEERLQGDPASPFAGRAAGAKSGPPTRPTPQIASP
jgi:hypothetical protein